MKLVLKYKDVYGQSDVIYNWTATDFSLIVFCRKNAYAMLSNEEAMQRLKPEQLSAIKAGGKSVEELTSGLWL